jgi:hypothetical protein
VLLLIAFVIRSGSDSMPERGGEPAPGLGVTADASDLFAEIVRRGSGEGDGLKVQHLDGGPIWCEHRGGESGPIGQSREVLVLVPPRRRVSVHEP